MEAAQHFGIFVDKEELIKALQYDRNQYVKGYSDGRASIVDELEKIKAEIEKEREEMASVKDWGRYYGLNMSLEIVDNHIAELKGE